MGNDDHDDRGATILQIITISHTIVIDDMENDAEAMAGEAPKIKSAVKNYLSYRMATTAGGGGGGGDARALLDAARALLKAVNSATLITPVAYGAAHPQGEHQTGLDRMAEIGAYKVAAALHEKAKPHAADLLGRSFLRIAWPQILQAAKSSMVGLIANNEVDGMDFRTSFFEEFGSTLSVPTEEADDADDSQETKSAANHNADSDLRRLVWTNDFAAELERRKKARQAEAAKRAQEWGM